MPCRVGITTDPTTRRAAWEREVVGLTGWQILTNFTSRTQAQAYETQYAQTHGCEASPGGANAPGTWSVYRFDYTRTRS